MSGLKSKSNFTMLMILIFLITFGLGILLGNLINPGGIGEAINLNLGKSYNILVMGVDTKNPEENSRSDTIILVSINNRSKDIAMVWIPRDTRVETGKNRYDKINSINCTDGPEAAAAAVGKLLDLKVDYYITTHFSGFAKIIDILGGVRIDVPYDMRNYSPDPDLDIDIAKGQQVLNGHDALSFVRFRGGPTADIGRTGRQQLFIKALASEMFSTKAVLKLPQLLPEIIKNVHTNIPMKEMLYLAEAARDFEQGNIKTQTLPGYPYTDPKNGASYWVADEDIARGIVTDLLKGKEFDVAQDPPLKTAPQQKADDLLEEKTESMDEIENEGITEEREETEENIENDTESAVVSEESEETEENIGSDSEATAILEDSEQANDNEMEIIETDMEVLPADGGENKESVAQP